MSTEPPVLAGRRGFVHRFDRLTLTGRRWFFTVKGGNGEPVAQSESYNSPEARDQGVDATWRALEADRKARGL